MSSKADRREEIERRRAVIERLLMKFSPVKREKIARAVNRGIYHYVVK